VTVDPHGAVERHNVGSIALWLDAGANKRRDSRFTSMRLTPHFTP
jgi:hypothetical protein